MLLVAVGGCNRSERINAIAGVYRGSYGGATEIIELSTNGLFVQKLYLNGTCQYTNDGTWKLEKKPAKFDPTFHLVLTPFLCAFDSRSRLISIPPSRFEYYYADWDSTNQRLEFNSENGYFLTKTNRN
jgi:hypothetical protein